MTEEQRENLFTIWNLYEVDRQKELFNQYLDLCRGYYSEEGFMAFLKDQMKLEGYWQNVGVA